MNYRARALGIVLTLPTLFSSNLSISLKALFCNFHTIWKEEKPRLQGLAHVRASRLPSNERAIENVSRKKKQHKNSRDEKWRAFVITLNGGMSVDGRLATSSVHNTRPGVYSKALAGLRSLFLPSVSRRLIIYFLSVFFRLVVIPFHFIEIVMGEFMSKEQDHFLSHEEKAQVELSRG